MNDFTEGHAGKQILAFTLPMIAANLMMLSYQFIDSVIIGTYIGKSALAAVSASYPVLFCVISLMIGLGSGAMVVVSQYFGAKRSDMVQKTTETINVIMVAAGIVIGVLGWNFSDRIFLLMGLPSEAMNDATAYMSVYLGGIAVSFMFYTFSSMLRGTGDSVTPMVMYAGSAVLNIVLDMVLIAGFGMGVKAAAASTLASMLIMYIAGAVYVNWRGSNFRVVFTAVPGFDMDICRHCLRYGLPSGGQQFMVAMGSIVMMGIVSGYGTDAVAGYGAGMRIGNIATLPAMNFASALAVYAGHNIGAGKHGRMKEGLECTLLFAGGISLAFTLLLQVFSADIAGLFSDDANVISACSEYLSVTSLFYIVYSTMFVTEGFLRGVGAVKAVAAFTILGLWVVGIPMSFAMAHAMGTAGIWWAVAISWAVECAVALLFYRKGGWRNRSVIDTGNSF